MYLVTRTANLYMHRKWRNVPRSRPLGALPPVPVVHAGQCTRTHANAVRGQPVRHVVQAGERLPLRAECHAGQPPVGEAVRHLPTRAHCSTVRTARASPTPGFLTPARCAELPPAAREAGQHWPRRRSFPLLNAPLADSDGAEARRAASGRSGGFAQSCGWCWSFDRGRSDPRSRHPQGSCGRFARVLSAMPVTGCLRPRPSHSGQNSLQIVFARIVLLTT